MRITKLSDLDAFDGVMGRYRSEILNNIDVEKCLAEGKFVYFFATFVEMIPQSDWFTIHDLYWGNEMMIRFNCVLVATDKNEASPIIEGICKRCNQLLSRKSACITPKSNEAKILRPAPWRVCSRCWQDYPINENGRTECTCDCIRIRYKKTY
jgi:hypothetical protein